MAPRSRALPIPKASLLPLLLALSACPMGCAIAPRDAGGYVLGMAVTGEPGTPDDLGRTASGILGAFGVPGADWIGAGVTALAAAFGWGAVQRRKGERVGWDEHDREGGVRVIAAPGVLPVAGPQAVTP
jgi:hypothetical protein